MVNKLVNLVNYENLMSVRTLYYMYTTIVIFSIGTYGKQIC